MWARCQIFKIQVKRGRNHTGNLDIHLCIRWGEMELRQSSGSWSTRGKACDFHSPTRTRRGEEGSTRRRTWLLSESLRGRLEAPESPEKFLSLQGGNCSVRSSTASCSPSDDIRRKSRIASKVASNSVREACGKCYPRKSSNHAEAKAWG